MEPKERRAQLQAVPRQRKLWLILLVTQTVNALFALYSIVAYLLFLRTTTDPAAVTTTVVTISLAALILYTLLSMVLTWSVFLVARWVGVLAWVSVGFALLTFNVIGFILSFVLALGYRKLPKPEAQSQTTPPTAS